MFHTKFSLIFVFKREDSIVKLQSLGLKISRILFLLVLGISLQENWGGAFTCQNTCNVHTMLESSEQLFYLEETMTIFTRTMEQDGLIRTHAGFMDSSFYYQTSAELGKTSFCFQGDIEKVCEEIQKAASEMQTMYCRGTHDSIEINYCRMEYENGEKWVDTRYRLFDDYRGNYQVQRKIIPCEEE